MHHNRIPPYPRVDALFQMQLQIDSHHHLVRKHEHKHIGHGCVNVGRKLTTTMFMTEEIACYCKDGAEGLNGDVPSRPDNLEGSLSKVRLCGNTTEGTYPKDHASRKDNAKSKNLHQYVDP